MKSVLVVDDQEDIIEILEIYIEGHLDDIRVLKANGGYEAIEFLEEEDIDAIICDFRMPDGDGRLVYEHNLKSNNIPFAWHSGTFDVDEDKVEKKSEYFVLDKPVEEKMLVKALQLMLAVSSTNDNLYRKIKVSNLRRLKEIDFDIYYKLNDDKYIELAKEGREDLGEVLEKYETKGVEYLYIKPKEIKKIFDLKQDELKNKIDKSGSVEDIYFVASEVIDHFYDDLQEKGLSEEQIFIANKCVNKCLKEFNKDVSLKKLISNVIDQDNYISTHSLITVHVANAILSKYPKYKVDLEHISMAAILHDLKFPNVRLARIRDFSSPEFKALSHAEKRMVMSHGIELALDLEDANLSKEVIDLIKNHELFGNEIKRGLELSQMETLFHISHEIAHYLTEEGFTETLKYVKNNEEKYLLLIGKDLYQEIIDFLN